MFSSQIARNKERLTGSEQVIANYLIKKYGSGKDNKMMSSEQIARNVGVGQATVIRFSQKLEYPSFKSMMLDLINESFYFGETSIHNDEEVRSTISKLQYQYEQSIKEVVNINSDDSINQAVRYLEKAGTILCFGTRSSNAIVSLMHYRLLEIGMNTLCPHDLTSASSIAHNMKENDVALILSVSGESPEAVKIANIAKKHHARVISITGSIENHLSSLSDIALKCAEYNVHTNRFNLVNRSSELFLLDLLFIRFWRDNEEKLIENCNEFSEETSEILSVNMKFGDSYRL